MEKILVEFISTVEISLKKIQEKVRASSGFSNLSFNQYRYIDAISELGEPTLSEIAERLHITKASVTIGIHKLIVLGFVNKTQSIQDKRVFHVNLTEAGNQLTQAMQKGLKEYGAFLRAALSEEEARQFEIILMKIMKRFNSIEFENH
jgi:DNA-binding MarR family transcriptional regulator